ncbi:MAG: hypothetical protein ACI4NU_00230 [Christensenellales bacterium]
MSRKLISIVLTFMFVIMLVMPSALAFKANNESEVEIVRYNNSYLYTEQTASWYLCIAAEFGKPIDVAISYANCTDYIYETKLDFNSITASFASNAFWQEVKSHFISGNQKKSVLNCNEDIKDNMPALRASATSTIYSKLRGYYGNAYSNRQIYTTTQYAPYTVKVTEDLSFDAYKVKTVSLSTAMSVASIVTAFSLPGKLGVVISTLFGLGSLAATLPAGTSFEYYRGVALFTRRGLTNGTPMVSATKTDIYYAAESGGVTEMTAYSDRDTIYSPYEYDFETTALARSAYDTYVAIYG